MKERGACLRLCAQISHTCFHLIFLPLTHGSPHLECFQSLLGFLLLNLWLFYISKVLCAETIVSAPCGIHFTNFSGWLDGRSLPLRFQLFKMQSLQLFTFRFQSVEPNKMLLFISKNKQKKTCVTGYMAVTEMCHINLQHLRAHQEAPQTSRLQYPKRL